ncbi:carcinoembryonic antigen-related cell adhesion molecule 1 isoform X2 [Carassius carassius]|uniref:carcinoembryonic antigen-related cell adhesion molecule 1 isoform X2 n=1 Tax=Carassius carassius TaxID=217509 RepID=UPI00286976FC|nr:carcinoembryonic antigen-related cell adhesion molecule 1 isoform X2 [Carassius carassius]
MGHKVLAIFFTLICAPGLYAVFLIPSKNPVAVGTNVTIRANDTGIITIGVWLHGPSTLFIWYPGGILPGTSLQNGTAFDSSTYQLTLSSVTLMSSGLYVLESLGPIKTRAEITLDVQEPVSNVTAFVSMTNLVEFNDNVTFTCTAVSGNPLWFSWQNGSSTVTAGGRVDLRNGGRELFINGVMRYDEGPFKCLVENNISKAMSNQMNLNISYGPNNTAASGPHIAEVGSSVTFSCSSVSRPQSQYSWYFNGLSVKNGSVYVTAPLSKTGSGEYTCMAFNSITGRSSSSSVTLAVYVPVSNVTVNRNNQQPIFNQPFTLTCTASGDVKNIQWMKNGTKIYSDNRINFTANNSVLNFNPLTLSDNGLYQCLASTAVNNMTSAAYDLQVFYGPRDTTIAGPIVGAIGRNVTFSCSADSNPASRYSWFLNSTKVGEGPVLTRALSLDSGGRYTCIASNDITGSISNVSLKLTLMYPVSNVIVNAGNQPPVFSQPFTLTCTASGDVEHIQWMKNSMFLHPRNGITFSTDNSTLSFQSLNLNDDGYYQCEANNAVSLMTSLVYDLKVNYGPWNTTVVGPSMEEMGSNVTFSCSATSRPSQYSWFYNNSKVGDGPVFVNAALSLTSSGRYTCMAYNNITGSSSNASLEFTVIEAIVTVDITSNNPIPLASQSLQLTCNVKGAYNRLHWLRNNQYFQPSDRVKFSADNTTVTFKALQTADDGRYQCVASNAVRPHFSQPYDLAVIFGPESVTISVRPGIPPVLTCQALSRPPAVYKWILENNAVVGNYSSIVLPVNSIFGSNYTCVAKNPLTNVTLYMTHILNYPDAAVSVQASVMLTALLVLLIPVLDEWL